MKTVKMTPQVQALVIRNLRNAIAELRAKEIVRDKQIQAMVAELEAAERGEW